MSANPEQTTNTFGDVVRENELEAKEFRSKRSEAHRDSINQIRALESRPRGKGCSKTIGDLSNGATEQLKARAAQFTMIIADESRASAEKCKFLQSWIGEVGKIAEISLAKDAATRANAGDQAAAKPELSTHQAILLAESLKSADKANRLRMVSGDQRYLSILEDLPAQYFGLTKSEYDELIDHAAESILTPEQRVKNEIAAEDQRQVERLETARQSLLDAIKEFIEMNAESVKKSEQNSHLYRL